MTEQRTLAELSRLDGRVAVVTGGASGIGFGIGRRLGEAGAHVVLADIDKRVEDSSAELREAGFEASAAILDVTQDEQHRQVADAVAAEHGRLDIWVNNAGIYPMNIAVDMTPEDWRKVMAVNLDGAFFGARAAATHMLKRGSGVILNVASTAGFRVSNDGVSHYAASKSGVRGLTQALAREFGPGGVRVLGIAPTFTITDTATDNMTNIAAIASADGTEKVTKDDVLDRYIVKIPLRRVATADDMAVVATFCVSDMAGYVTGSIIPVDGGMLAV